MTSCGRGWGSRCPDSQGRTCRCSCGGKNHGLYRQERELRQSVEPLMSVPMGGWTVGPDGKTQLVLGF
jgi:hypothetical protein